MRCPKGMLLNLLIFSLFNLLTAAAAAVPQDSPAKYYFSCPNLPSNIVGRIIGSPAEYSVMRSEDIAWLSEAFMERAALQARSWSGLSPEQYLRPEFGLWPLSETNRFARWTAASLTTNGVTTTNIIVGYNYATNFGTGTDTARIKAGFIYGDLYPLHLLENLQCDPAGYLATNESLLVSTPAVMPLYGSVTSIWTTTTWTNVATNATAVITMAMTNGTVSAYTNRWTATSPGEPYQVSHTNITSRTDIDAVFSGGRAIGYAVPIPEDGMLRGTYRAAAITNHYAWLDGMHRLAGYASYTNRLDGWRYEWSMDSSATNYPYGGFNTAGHFLFSASRAHYAQWNGSSQVTTTSGSGYENCMLPETATLVFESPYWTTNAMLAGGVDRLSLARVWAITELYHSEAANAVDQYWRTNAEALVALPVGEAARVDGAPGDTRLLLAAAVNLRDIYDQALAAAGFAVPVRGTYPDLHFPLPPASADDTRTSSSTSVITECSMRFVIVCDFNPWTQMPGGSQ